MDKTALNGSQEKKETITKLSTMALCTWQTGL